MDFGALLTYVDNPVSRAIIEEFAKSAIERAKERFGGSKASQNKANQNLDATITSVLTQLRLQRKATDDIQTQLIALSESPRRSANFEKDLELGAKIDEPITRDTLARLITQGLKAESMGPREGLYRKATESLEYIGERQLRALAGLCVDSGTFKFPDVTTSEELSDLVARHFTEERGLFEPAYTDPDMSLLASLGLCTTTGLVRNLTAVFTQGKIAPNLKPFLESEGLGRVVALRHDVLQRYDLTAPGKILGVTVRDVIHGITTHISGLD